MATELATAYVSLIPSIKGAGKSIAAQLGSVDVSASGAKMGRQLSAAMSANVSTDALKGLNDAVAKAAKENGAAMAVQKEATAQLAIAEQRLVEVKAKHAAGSSQVMAAEHRVTQAREREAQASLRLSTSSRQLENAEKQLSSAKKQLAADAAKVPSAFDRIKASASSLKGGVSSAAAGIKSSFSGIGGVVAGAVAAMGIGQLVSEAAAATDATQKFKSTLDFAGLDTSAIDALTQSTRAYADATVYELGDIQNITAQLAANGVADYDRLAEAAGNLNAVAGGNAETYKSVGMVMTQTAGAGKLTTENWNQLADAIPGASGKLQEAMLQNGAYTGNFREAMEKGEISAEEFNQAIMQLGFEDAAVNAAKSTSTFEGAIGNLKASVVGGLSDTLAQLQPLITGAINGMVPAVEGAFSLLGQGVSLLVGTIQSAMPMFQTAIAPVVDAFAALAPVFAPIVAQVQGALMPALASLGNTVMALFAAIMPVIATAVSTVGPIIAQIISIVVQLATTLASSIAPVVQNIAAVVTAVLPHIQAMFSIFGSYVSGVINAVFPLIQTVITTVMNVVNAVITTVLAAINGDWSGVWSGIQGIASSVWSGIQSVISAAINAVKGVISSVMSTVKSLWSGAWSSVKSLVSSAWDGIKSTVSGGVDGMMGFISSIPGRIQGAFADAGSWLISSGKSVIDGFVRGIQGAIGGAISAVSGAVQSIRDLFPFSPAKIGPFSGRGWVLYSGMSIADAMAEGFERRTPAMVGAYRSGMASLSSALTPDAATPRGNAQADRVEALLSEILYAIPDMNDRAAGRWVRSHA